MKTPFKKIKTYLDNQNTDAFQTMLVQRKFHLHLEKKQIERTEKLLKATIKITKQVLSNDLKTPYIQNLEAESLLVIDVDHQLSEREKILKVYSKYRHCIEQCLFASVPSGSIIKQENISNRSYINDQFFFSVLDNSCCNAFVQTKPAGNYATILHKGFRNDIEESYQLHFNFIKEKGFEIEGPAYETSLIDSLASTKDEDRVIEITILINDH